MPLASSRHNYVCSLTVPPDNMRLPLRKLVVGFPASILRSFPDPPVPRTPVPWNWAWLRRSHRPAGSGVTSATNKKQLSCRFRAAKAVHKSYKWKCCFPDTMIIACIIGKHIRQGMVQVLHLAICLRVAVVVWWFVSSTSVIFFIILAMKHFPWSVVNFLGTPCLNSRNGSAVSQSR